MIDKPSVYLTVAAALLGGAGLVWSHAATAQQVTAVSFGGAYQEAQSKALFQPAAKAMGITVRAVQR